MKETKLGRLSERYLAALQKHTVKGSETGFRSAHDLGARALSLGLETLDLAKIHDQALGTLLSPGSSNSEREDLTRRAALFFTEALLPIERTHRSAMEASAGLVQLNETLVQRTLDLAKSQRDLEQGIAEHKKAVESLRSSKDESATLLRESHHLQKHLQEMAHRILSTQENQRKAVSLKLQDDIAQTLLGIHVRLLALKQEVTVRTADFKKEIATTQRLVQESVKSINHFAREIRLQDES